MRSRIMVVLTAVVFVSGLAGCGKKNDPAGDALSEFAGLAQDRRWTTAFPKYAYSKDMSMMAMKSWAQTYDGFVPGKTLKCKYMDATGKEVENPDDAAKAEIHYQFFINGVPRSNNKFVRTIPCIKEKDSSGKGVWRFRFGHAKMRTATEWKEQVGS